MSDNGGLLTRAQMLAELERLESVAYEEGQLDAYAAAKALVHRLAPEGVDVCAGCREVLERATAYRAHHAVMPPDYDEMVRALLLNAVLAPCTCGVRPSTAGAMTTETKPCPECGGSGTCPQCNGDQVIECPTMRALRPMRRVRRDG